MPWRVRSLVGPLWGCVCEGFDDPPVGRHGEGLRLANDNMLILHANYADHRLHLWAECAESADALHAAPVGATSTDGGAAEKRSHPFVRESLLEDLGAVLGRDAKAGALELELPSREGSPLPSPQLAHRVGLEGFDRDEPGVVSIERWGVSTVSIPCHESWIVLERLADLAEQPGDVGGAGGRGKIVLGAGLRFFLVASRLGRSLLAEQRFVPMLVQEADGSLAGEWRPWLSDTQTKERMGHLLASMPPICRAVNDGFDHSGYGVLAAFLGELIDGACRAVMVKEHMSDAVAGQSDGDPHVGWLTGLLGDQLRVGAAAEGRASMLRRVRHWVGGLEDRGVSSEWCLRFRVHEPLVFDDAPDSGEAAITGGADQLWAVTFHLQSLENEAVVIDAEDVWATRSSSITSEGLLLESPQELLLTEVARAARLYKPLEAALQDSEPFMVNLSTPEAYEFLREIAPLLAEQGFAVDSPAWWDTPAARIGGRLRIDSPDMDPGSLSSTAPGAVGSARLGLNALVSYEWQLAVGDTPISLKEFEELASQGSPLVRVNGQWVEIRKEDIESAVEFLHENPGGEMRIGEALRLAFAPGVAGDGLPILGVDATGWAAAFLGDLEDSQMTLLDAPEGFKGELRPYQRKGLSWLSFLDQIGLGPCLADDMGLGKTVQLLALLLHERRAHEEAVAKGIESVPVGPTLLVVPMSIVGNWVREAERFAPSLRVHIHHGADRVLGKAFHEKIADSDLVVTTYALTNRDRELIGEIEWHRVVLDEAQNIKNPAAKQSIAVRTLDAPRRIALTGTPLENRLSELWSIMDFCNPGFLGSAGEFRRLFSIPVERYRDKSRARQLREMVKPFVLRRLKTDPTVISDLPDKIENKEYCRLTPEQAQLYETTVKEMLGEVERSEGIRRRGVVLTTLIRLKQICNHPGLMLKDTDDELGTVEAPTGASAGRSGKCIRLLEMLEEVVHSGEQALVFTQFRQMGAILSSVLRQKFDRDVLFLHGGVPQKQRERMVERFQQADGSAPIFLLSLKAGGVGLNLTAASHVFHFDRWWNPAVENQATDRAFRIGQKRTVNVHKFIVGGTLEERIDQMIESKVALAQDIIGAGEDWLTELSVSQLRDVLALRPDAIGDEEMEDE